MPKPPPRAKKSPGGPRAASPRTSGPGPKSKQVPGRRADGLPMKPASATRSAGPGPKSQQIPGRRADGLPMKPAPAKRATGPAKPGAGKRAVAGVLTPPPAKRGAAAPQRQSPVAVKRAPARRSQKSGLRIGWSGFRVMYDYWGNEIPRFYQLDTLASAVEYHFATRDQFIMPTITEGIGTAPLSNLKLHLFQEGRFQLIFKLSASNTDGRKGAWAFVAAKNHLECSDVARAEHRMLHILHERAPEDIVRPFHSGVLYLPDRHGRKEHGREVFAYMTQWLEGYEELGIHKNLQLMVNVAPHHLFTVAQTEFLKGEMVRIVARTYNAQDQTCMALPEIASGDFVVRVGTRGKLSIRLIACRSMQQRTKPARLIDQMLDAGWDWGGRKYRFIPEEPETFLNALIAARGEQEARAWIIAYVDAVKARRYPRRRPAFLEGLAALVAK